jgi:tetratricopeptide (TPR) repeat protein
MAFIISIVLVVLLVFASFWLVSSEYLETHTTHGWIFLLVFLGVYFHFCMLLFNLIEFSDIIAALAVMAIASLILFTQGPFILTLISSTFVPDASKGLKLLKTYSEAERNVAAEDLPGAISEYEKVIAEDPDDMTARFRLADLCYQSKDYPKAVEAYKTLATLKDKLDQYQHCSALMRLSEIHAQNLGDIETARKYLQDIAREYADTKFAGYAQNRLDNLQ